MNYDSMQTQNRAMEPLPPVCDTVSRALTLATDIEALAGTISDKLFGSPPVMDTASSAIALAPGCVVDFLEVITGVLLEAAHRLTEINSRL